MLRWIVLAAILQGSPAVGLDLVVQGGVLTRAEGSPASLVRLPDAPAGVSDEPPVAEGAIRRRAYRIPGGAQTTLQLLEPLRRALREAGYAEVFTCRDVACGGFDFRFQLDILGEPDMHVDLGDFMYSLSERGAAPDGPMKVALLASRGRDAGYLHITEVFEADAVAPAPEAVGAASPVVGPSAVAAGDGSLGERLMTRGHVVLGDLDFGSGAAELAGEVYESLDALAEWLRDNPAARVVLVGHTDAVGSLEANTALSARRAEAVRTRLIETYGTEPAQLDATGIGYLAPQSSNLTENGRADNRRVEVVLLSNGT